MTTVPTSGGSASGGPALVLFDGVCNVCNGSVRWIIARDRREAPRFRFASLQSRAGREAIAGAGRDLAALPDSLVLIEYDRGGGPGTPRVSTRSDAVIRIARRLGLPWSAAVAALALPRPVRDALYSWVARNRYRWFGKREACMVPTPELRARFADADEATEGARAGDA
jgi:predicted DCC family thiol-disulfide oxidoreductase YuxK